MSRQMGLDLGEGSGDPMPPYAPGSETSREAARQMAQKAGTIRVRYLKTLYHAGDRGQTDWEAHRGLSCSYTSIQPRRAELNDMLEEDLVVDSGIRRTGQSDVKTVAWTLTECGREIVEQMREGS